MAGEVRLGGDGERAQKPGQLVEPRRRRRSSTRRRASSRAAASSSPTRSSTSRSTSPAAAASTSAPRPAASRTACCSAARARRGARRRLRRARLAPAQRRARDGARAHNARACARRAALRARPRRHRRVVHLADEGPAGGARCCAAAHDVLAMVKPQFEAGRGRSARAASCATPPTGAGAACWSPRRARALGAAVLGFASSGLPGPKGNRESFVWLAEAGRAGERRRPRGRRARGRAVTAPADVTVLTHTRPQQVAPSLRASDRGRARERRDAALRPAETAKHGLTPGRA